SEYQRYGRFGGTWPGSAARQARPLAWRAELMARAALAALNGGLGDSLAASKNPLAIAMGLRREGHPLPMDAQALGAAIPKAGGKVVVLVHGLCMNDLQWSRQGHDHGATLARDLGYTPVSPLQHRPSCLHQRARAGRSARRPRES